MNFALVHMYHEFHFLIQYGRKKNLALDLLRATIFFSNVIIKNIPIFIYIILKPNVNAKYFTINICTTYAYCLHMKLTKRIWNHHIKISIRCYINQYSTQLPLQSLCLNHKGLANKTITTSVNNLLLLLTPLFYIML